MVLTLIHNLVEGMTIAKPVIIQGRTLLTAGSQLSSKHIQILKAWGVSDIWIEGNSGQCSDAIDIESEVFSEIKAKYEFRFSKCIPTDVITELKRIIIVRECVNFKLQNVEGKQM
jgi:hypothetical protein